MPANWEWADDEGQWTPYHHKDNLLIEAAFASGVTEFKTKDLSFNAEYGSLYVYDFTRLLQKNTDSGRVRKLRRTETSGMEEEKDFMMSFLTASPATAAAAPSSPVHHAVTEEPPMKKAKIETPPAAVVSAPPSSPPKVAPSSGFSFPPLACAATPMTAAPTVVVPPAAVPAPLGGWAAPSVPASPSPVVHVVPAVPPPTVTSPPPPVVATPTTAVVTSHVPPVDPSVIAAQTALGAQSKRNQKVDYGHAVMSDPHGKSCFDKMLYREKQLCGEFAVFYHSYSFAALLYEVQAAVAAVLFRFKSEYATLPRLLKKPYEDLPDAAALLKLFPKMASRDHDPRFRAVAISATSSLLASDSEAPPKTCFLHGYSCADLSFKGVLENLLVSCGVPGYMKTSLADKIIGLCKAHGLDASQFGGKGCSSGRPGHMLQLFVKRSVVDQLVYAALPFGVKDTKRPVLSTYLCGSGPIQGQVRIVTNPSTFMRGNAVRMYVYSADPTFHANRPKFQKELTELLDPIIGGKLTRLKAAEGIYGGKVPAWFNPDDYEEEQKKKAAAAAGAAAAATVAAGGGVTMVIGGS